MSMGSSLSSPASVSIAARAETSSLRTRTAPLIARVAAAVSGSRHVAKTRYPSAAQWRANSTPSPVSHPVIKTLGIAGFIVGATRSRLLPHCFVFGIRPSRLAAQEGHRLAPRGLRVHRRKIGEDQREIVQDLDIALILCRKEPAARATGYPERGNTSAPARAQTDRCPVFRPRAEYCGNRCR